MFFGVKGILFYPSIYYRCKKMKYIPQIGDIIIIWGKAWYSKVIKFCIYILFGIKDSPTHCEIVAIEDYDISAEASGVQLVERKKALEGAKKYIIARHKDMTQEKQDELFYDVFPKYIGKKYDYFLFILWFMRVSLVMQPLVWLALQPYYNWLKKQESRTYGCSELVSEIMSEIGISFGIENHTNATPADILQVIRASSDWEIIYRGGKNE